MAKICEHCKQPYPDNLDHCPNCPPAAQLVDEDEAETFFLRPEEGQAKAPGQPAKTSGTEEEALDLAGHERSGPDPNSSGVVLGLEPEDVLPASGQGSGPHDSAVDLVHPADDLDLPGAPPGNAGRPRGAAEDSWAALVEEHEAAPAEGGRAPAGPASDVHPASDVFPAEEADDAAPTERGRAPAGPASDVRPASDVYPAEEADAEAWVLHEAKEGEGSAVNYGAMGPRPEGSSASDVRPVREPGEGMGSGSDINLAGRPRRDEGSSGSDVRPVREGTGSGSDINLAGLPERAEGTSASDVRPVREPDEPTSAIHLSPLDEPGSGSSAIDLSGPAEAHKEPSAIDLSGLDEAGAAGGSGSAINLDSAGEEAPGGDLHFVPEALEPGSSQEYMGKSHPEVVADEGGAHAERAEEAGDEVTLGDTAAASTRDIVEEVESGVDLDKPRQRAAAEPDSAVDLGAPTSSAEEGGPSSSSVRLGEHDEEHTRGDSDAAAAALLGGDDEQQTREEALAGLPTEGEAEPETLTAAGEEVEEAGETEEIRERDRRRPALPAVLAGREHLVPWVGGGLIGAGTMAVLVAALWLLNLLPSRQPAKAVAPPVAQAPNQAPAPAAAPAPTLDLGETQLHAGDFSKALETFNQVEQANAQNPEFLAARGQALWLKTLQQLKQENKPLTKDELAKNEDVQKAKADLEKAGTSNALLWLGLIQEYTEGPDAARKTYEQAMAKHPDQRRRFQAAIDRLDLSAPEPAPGARLEPTPGLSAELYWMSVALLALQAPGAPANPQGGVPPGGAAPAPGQPAPAPAAPGSADEEAGYDFWNAVKLARENKYPAAIDALKQARTLHDRLRYTRFGRAQNPTSDPTEEIFLRACDELEVFWKVREKLAEAGYLDVAHRATQRDILAAVDKATKAEANVKAAQKTATELQAALKDAGISGTDPAKGVGDLVEGRKKAEKKLDDVLAALKTAGVKADDPVKAVADLEESKKKADKKVADVVAALETAGVKGDDPVKGVAELEDSKKAVQKKVDAVAAALKAAGIPTDDPVTGTEKALAALGQSNGELDAMRKQLVDRKYLPADAKRGDVPAGLDHALQDTEHPLSTALAGMANSVGSAGGKLAGRVVQALDREGELAAARMNTIRLEAELAERWTPEQMLDVWLTALQDHPSPALADEALRDARLAMKDKPVPAAVCVKALAERSKGQYAEARADLQELLKSPPPPESPWLPVARSALRQLTDPAAYYVPRVRDLRAEKKYDQALALLDQGLQVFSEDANPGAHAALLALRSEVRLDQGRSAGAGELPAAALKASDQDARAAVTGGEKVEGNYAMGRVAETSGDLPRAEAFYRQSVEAYDAAAKDAAGFSKAHPVCDPLGNRYREALTRVLLEEVRQGKATPPRPEAPPEGRKSARLDADQVLSVVRPFCSGGLVQLACVTLALAQPTGGAVAPVEPPDPRLEEVLAQADRMIAAGDHRGYLLKAEALGRLHRWADALQATKEGVQRALPQQEAAPLAYVLENHPAFERREGIKPPDPAVAEGHYETGLRQYFDGRYAEAERNFADAVYYNDQDARYLYFLGLARLAEPGKRDTALEDFRQAGRLEAMGQPSSAAVSVALERVQGPARRILNGVRERAIEEATAKAP